MEAHRHGEQWAARQRTNSNKTQCLHDELNPVDIEPLVDTFWQMKAQLYELEPQDQLKTYQQSRVFINPKDVLGDFIFIKKIKKKVLFFYFNQIKKKLKASESGLAASLPSQPISIEEMGVAS